MYEQEITILFYGTIAGLATILGIIAMSKKQQWALTNSHYINSFAAGLILGLVFFHLLPEAIELSEISFIATFFGFFVFFTLENFIVIHSGSEIHFCYDEESDSIHTSPRLGLMAFSGLALHSFIDGIIIGVGFEISAEIGFLAAVAVILHEVPEGITSFALITKAIPDKARILSLIVAVSTPLGAIISLLFIGVIGEELIGILLAIASGTFLYVAAADLLPETHGAKNIQNLVTFIIGAFFIYSISLI
jgi:zinc and cadmium transporter